MRLVIVSDTHDRHSEIVVPDGDVLIHAGDMTMSGDLEEIEEVGCWLKNLPHRDKIIIAGNHDWAFQLTPAAARRALGDRIIYLQDSGTIIDGVNFWGSPWQPWFYDWAFNLHPGIELAEKWALIPSSTDVLITHGPPKNVLDQNPRGDRVGCADLAKRLRDLHVKVHAFGHIHQSSGIYNHDGVTYVNACICDEAYNPANPPRVVDI